jgi:hypothetical protein
VTEEAFLPISVSSEADSETVCASHSLHELVNESEVLRLASEKIIIQQHAVKRPSLTESLHIEYT